VSVQGLYRPSCETLTQKLGKPVPSLIEILVAKERIQTVPLPRATRALELNKRKVQIYHPADQDSAIRQSRLRPAPWGPVSDPMRFLPSWHRACLMRATGLKAVHRRILFAMRELRLNSTGDFLGSPQNSRRRNGTITRMVTPRFTMRWRVSLKILTCVIRLVDGKVTLVNIDGVYPRSAHRSGG